jgi:CheY-like chemotaxis protein
MLGSVAARAGSDVLACLDGVRVLVVDDSAVIREMLADILGEHGAAVTAVGSAESALDAVTRERPDVLISDLEMPDKGGYWLIGQVRALSPERGGAIPAAALTGLHGPEHRATALRAGFQYHLEKPVDLHSLVGIVESLAHGGMALARRTAELTTV